MLRFQPDSWLEGMLRPLLMADPSAGLYYEDAAPDWRFALIVLLLVPALLSGRLRTMATAEHKRWLLALAVLFYAWTFAIGNGRYFMLGLLLAGPLLVLVWQWLPGTKAFRWLTLGTLLAVQAGTVHTMYRPGAWNLVEWVDGPAVDIGASALRERPMTVVTITAISYSILVPSFHPGSRWMNLAGQVDMSPGRIEYPQAQALLDGPLPLMLLAPATQQEGQTIDQPNEKVWSVITQTLHPHGLAPAEARCEILRTWLLPHNVRRDARPVQPGAFWLCPLRRVPVPPAGAASDDPHAAVFERVERHCPRFFPPDHATSKRYDGYWQRYYLNSDTRLYVDDAGTVLFNYFRSFSPTVIGTVDDVRAGRMKLSCDKLPGRYRAPWESP